MSTASEAFYAIVTVLVTQVPHRMYFLFQFISFNLGKLRLKCEALQEALGCNTDSLPLNTLVKCREFKQAAEGPTPSPRIIYFDVPAKDIAFVRELHSKKVIEYKFGANVFYNCA